MAIYYSGVGLVCVQTPNTEQRRSASYCSYAHYKYEPRNINKTGSQNKQNHFFLKKKLHESTFQIDLDNLNEIILKGLKQPIQYIWKCTPYFVKYLEEITD